MPGKKPHSSVFEHAGENSFCAVHFAEGPLSVKTVRIQQVRGARVKRQIFPEPLENGAEQAADCVPFLRLHEKRRRDAAYIGRKGTGRNVDVDAEPDHDEARAGRHGFQKDAADFPVAPVDVVGPLDAKRGLGREGLYPVENRKAHRTVQGEMR